MAHLLVNPPCEVLFAGWRSSTYDLGRAGWDISFERADNHFFGLTVERMILRHKGAGLVGMARTREPFDTYRWRQTGGHQNMAMLPRFVVEQMHPGIAIHHEPQFSPFAGYTSWAMTEPMFVESTLHDHCLFLDKQAPAGETLIVEPRDVMQLLEQIKQMQSPEQAEIRKRRKAVPLAHATILSFGEAA